MGLQAKEKGNERNKSETKDSRIVSELKQRIAADIKDRAKQQQIGCHNDGSGGGHNDN